MQLRDDSTEVFPTSAEDQQWYAAEDYGDGQGEAYDGQHASQGYVSQGGYYHEHGGDEDYEGAAHYNA